MGRPNTADMTRRNTLLPLPPTPLRAARPPAGAACLLSVWDQGAETVVAVDTAGPVQLVVRGSDRLSTSVDSPLPPRSRGASISTFLTARIKYPCRHFLLSHVLRHVLLFDLRYRLGLFHLFYSPFSPQNRKLCLFLIEFPSYSLSQNDREIDDVQSISLPN